MFKYIFRLKITGSFTVVQDAGPILYDLPEFPRKKVRGAGRVGVLAITSSDKAMQMAGLVDEKELLKSGRVGVAYGSSMGSVRPLLDFVSMQNPPYNCANVSVTTYIQSMPQTSAVNVSLFFGLTGRVSIMPCSLRKAAAKT